MRFRNAPVLNKGTILCSNSRVFAGTNEVSELATAEMLQKYTDIVECEIPAEPVQVDDYTGRYGVWLSGNVLHCNENGASHSLSLYSQMGYHIVPDITGCHSLIDVANTDSVFIFGYNDSSSHSYSENILVYKYTKSTDTLTTICFYSYSTTSAGNLSPIFGKNVIKYIRGVDTEGYVWAIYTGRDVYLRTYRVSYSQLAHYSGEQLTSATSGMDNYLCDGSFFLRNSENLRFVLTYNDGSPKMKMVESNGTTISTITTMDNTGYSVYCNSDTGADEFGGVILRLSTKNSAISVDTYVLDRNSTSFELNTSFTITGGEYPGFIGTIGNIMFVNATDIIFAYNTINEGTHYRWYSDMGQTLKAMWDGSSGQLATGQLSYQNPLIFNEDGSIWIDNNVCELMPYRYKYSDIPTFTE